MINVGMHLHARTHWYKYVHMRAIKLLLLRELFCEQYLFYNIVKGVILFQTSEEKGYTNWNRFCW